jgi:hypothetical protein
MLSESAKGVHHRDAGLPSREPVLVAMALERLESLVAVKVVLVQEVDPQSGRRQSVATCPSPCRN